MREGAVSQVMTDMIIIYQTALQGIGSFPAFLDFLGQDEEKKCKN
ncbi:hypothetical protein ACFPYJ_16915 [Paenibacillus solisilvae]|uniref:Uncharacterized protein n=1 Tax=Paenibacillus solisilvae TaxID=2486751 RepID=A0ABW0VY14_9BACL